MSNETAPSAPNPAEISALDYAQKLAAEPAPINEQTQKTEDWLSDDGYIDREAAASMAEYLQSRPDGTEGQQRNHKGRFVKGAAAEAARDDDLYQATLGDHKSIEDKSLGELIADWADADDHDDKTLSEPTQDAILDRIDKTPNITEDHKAALIDAAYLKKESLRQNKTQTAESAEDLTSPLDIQSIKLDEVDVKSQAAGTQSEQDQAAPGETSDTNEGDATTTSEDGGEAATDEVEPTTTEDEQPTEQVGRHRGEAGSETDEVVADGRHRAVNELHPDDPIGEAVIANILEGVPLNWETPEDVATRVRKIFGKAKEALASVRSTKTQEQGKHAQEQGENTRKKIIATVGGAVAVASAVVLMTKDAITGEGSYEAEVRQIDAEVRRQALEDEEEEQSLAA